MQKKDLSILIGNGLDHFDTALYGFIAPILSTIFFPKTDPVVRLILVYSVLTTSIVTRPVGSIIFSMIVRKYGATLSLSYSLIGVAVATMSIGFIPSYQTIGLLSPLLLIIIRIVQGICAQGENTIAQLYIVENKCQIKGIKASYLYQLSTMLGIIIASFVSTVLINSSHHEYWRLCFILGGSAGIIGIYLRGYVSTSSTAVEQITKQKLTLRINILNNKRNILLISIITGFSYMTYIIPFVVMNSFVPLITSISLETMMIFNTLLLIIDTAMIPLIGYWLKKYNPTNIMIISSSLFFITIIPLWLYLPKASLWYITIVRLWIVILGVSFCCPLNYWLNSLFQGPDKYMLVGIGYALGTTAFGYFTPVICLSLWHFTNFAISIGIYLAIIALATIWTIRELHQSHLTKL